MGINVNGVAAGPFLTDMNIPFQHSGHAMRVLNHEVAMRRCGKLHEIQGPVLFLASDAASYITGVVLPLGRRLDRPLIKGHRPSVSARKSQ